MKGKSISIFGGSLWLMAICIACCSGFETKLRIIRIDDDEPITNGHTINIDEFPYIVQILDKKANDGPAFLCAGTLVSDRHVVTAAHCYKNYNSDDLIVVANATYLKNDEGAIRRDVEAINRHFKYDAKTDDSDIALIKLKEPVPFGKGIQKAELCPAVWKKSEQVVVSGWGRTSKNNAKHSNQLQTVTLDTLSYNECKSDFEDLNLRRACSISTKNQDACQGDPGGPAFYNGKLCGVISMGFGCGPDGFLGVYTRISSFLKFLAKYMEQ